jgi:hypothetical protein
LAATNRRTSPISSDPREAENVEKPKELDRHYRAREVDMQVEGDKGRI